MDAQNAVKICQEQERLLRFHTFTNAQAWELGSAMVGQLRARELPLCVAVWSLSGYVLFQYAPQGTTLNNQNWMRRKFNTVRLMEKSSLAARAAAELSGEGVEQAGLDPREYVFCGGRLSHSPQKRRTGRRGAGLRPAGYRRSRLPRRSAGTLSGRRGAPGALARPCRELLPENASAVARNFAAGAFFFWRGRGEGVGRRWSLWRGERKIRRGLRRMV